MDIRRLTVDDAVAYQALRLRALREHPEAFGSSYEDTAERDIGVVIERLRPDPARPDDFTLGAFEGQFVGSLVFKRDTARKLCHKGHLYAMYVAAEAGGRGIGTALVERAIAIARTMHGLEQIHLQVTSTNEVAVALYRQCGFIGYGREPRATKVKERYLDSDLMVYTFV